MDGGKKIARTVKARVYATCDQYTMLDLGEQLGFSGDVLRMFSHYNEVQLELTVDRDTGVVIDQEIVASRPMKKEGVMSREDAITYISMTYPPDSHYKENALLGRNLLEQARQDVGSWRHEPTEVLLRLAELCKEVEARNNTMRGNR